MNLMLIDNSAQSKKLYEENLPINCCFYARNIKEALPNLSCIDFILINNGATIKELEQVNQRFDGSVICRVEDEQHAISLLKQRLITDFYVRGEDDADDLDKLISVFRLGILRKNVSDAIRTIKKDVCELQSKLKIGYNGVS